MANQYFLTGSTGAIGSALLRLLLTESSNRIWALMRADTDEDAATRLERLIAFWELNSEQAEDARQRITVLKGDTDQNQFALPSSSYFEIVRQCTHIVHCAGVVRMNLPLEAARQHAMSATTNIIALAQACQASGVLRKVEFVSTVGVAGKMSGHVPETWITQARDFHNTYEQAKAEAEDYLRAHLAQHPLPVTVHRPSMVVGDSATGKIIHYQIFYHICEFLAGRRTFGLLPSLGDTRLDTVPVDYVAAAIKYSSEHPDSIGKIFHLSAGPKDAIPLTQLQLLVTQTFNEKGISVPIAIKLPVAVFQQVIHLLSPFVNEKISRSLKTFPFFLEYLSGSQAFDNSVSKHYFRDLPIPEKSLLRLTLRQYIQNRYQPTANQAVKP